MEIRQQYDCCGETDLIQIESYLRWPNLHIVQCKSCKYSFVKEIPTDEEIYEENKIIHI